MLALMVSRLRWKWDGAMCGAHRLRSSQRLGEGVLRHRYAYGGGTTRASSVQRPRVAVQKGASDDNAGVDGADVMDRGCGAGQTLLCVLQDWCLQATMQAEASPSA
ncbi:hypothetical protein NDU88_012034 [Pleurodeles waltl]|uniref:Uncharacterized protein n=1 Tax=Pleurodeles waltl TaxID=8319 RepID=A0AAV7R2T1_PLEWA|nr:hypothetical protein NDU88_012034 [Pleurodeles waltl]